MTDDLELVRDHYRAAGVTERLKAALATLGPEDRRFTPGELAGLDQFHTRGLAATIDQSKLARISADDLVLDVGAGLGGPARFVAATYGCSVVGVDLSQSFVDAARYLTERTGQTGEVSFQLASAAELPFDDGRFDVALLQHVAMNVADRAGLYREIRRVLKPAGRLATYDVVADAGEPIYPLPWARTPATSFLLSAAATRRSVEEAGFRTVEWRDDSEAAKAWAGELLAAGPPSGLNLGLVMGRDIGALAANLGRSFIEGRLGVVAAVFEVAPASA